MIFQRHVDAWWFEPKLTKKRVRIPASVRNLDPVGDHGWTPPRPSRIGLFAHSRKWVRYNRLQAIDAGYIAPLYALSDIALRYGLSHAGQRYFRKHILPEPFDIVRRRSVSAHHWSRFTLMVLDTVLLDLERRGFNQFLNSFEDHKKLLHTGVAYLHDYYTHKLEYSMVESTDRYGVQWVE